MASSGGKRKGAGRPKGAVNKFKLKERFTEKEINELVNDAKIQAKKDPNMLKFLLEQIFGKARQSVGISGEDDKPSVKIMFALEQELRRLGKN